MQRPVPHFLRVAQALAFVSGFGPVAIVAATAGACSSSSTYGGQSVGMLDGAPFDAADGSIASNDAGAPDSRINFPTDAKSDVLIVGGPLSPPELPA